MIRGPELKKLLEARIQNEPSMWGIRGPAMIAIDFVMPFLIRLIRDEIAEARREWLKAERQA